MIETAFTREEAEALRNTVPSPALAAAKDKLQAALDTAEANEGNAHAPKTRAEIVQALTLAHEAAKGKGDQGAFDVWNTVSYLLACEGVDTATTKEIA